MTSTTIINAQSFGTSTNVGNGKFSVSPTTVNAGTQQYAVAVSIANGAGLQDANEEVRVWYATSQDTFTAANAVISLRSTARYVDLRPDPQTGIIRNRNSQIEAVLGQNFYCWVDAPGLPTAATITVKLLELTPGASAQVPGTGATNLGKAEDAAAASGDTGVAIWGVRRDAPVISASASGDYNEIALTKYGAQLSSPLGHTAKTFRAVANVTAVAAATDIALLPGNATNTVQLLRVIISGIQTTAGLVDILLIKRSTAFSGGTSGAMTSVPLDSTDAAAISLPLSITGNGTPGAAVGTIDRRYLEAAPLATGISGGAIEFDFARYGKPVFLAGVAQSVVVNLNGATVTGGIFNIVFEWLEVA